MEFTFILLQALESIRLNKPDAEAAREWLAGFYLEVMESKAA